MSLTVGIIIGVAVLIGLFGYSALIVGSRADGEGKDGIQDSESERKEQHLKQKRKAFEMVLCVPTNMINKYNDFEMLVNHWGKFRTRGSSDGKFPGVETDKRYKQVIPYFVFVNSDGKILAYKKNKTSSETRLHDMFSIGIGGHVNDNDGKGMSAVRQAAIRECKEEIGVFPQFSAISRNNDDYILIDIKGNAADYHIGYCQVVTGWHPEEIKLSEEVDKISWKSYDELKELELEEWSAYVLDLLKLDFAHVLEGVK